MVTLCPPMIASYPTPSPDEKPLQIYCMRCPTLVANSKNTLWKRKHLNIKVVPHSQPLTPSGRLVQLHSAKHPPLLAKNCKKKHKKPIKRVLYLLTPNPSGSLCILTAWPPSEQKGLYYKLILRRNHNQKQNPHTHNPNSELMAALGGKKAPI